MKKSPTARYILQRRSVVAVRTSRLGRCDLPVIPCRASVSYRRSQSLRGDSPEKEEVEVHVQRQHLTSILSRVGIIATAFRSLGPIWDVREGIILVWIRDGEGNGDPHPYLGNVMSTPCYLLKPSGADSDSQQGREG
jgi:hypothetical protein